MDALLTPVSTSYKALQPEEHLIEVVKPQIIDGPVQSAPATPSSLESALEILRNEPSFDAVRATLRYLVRDAPSTTSDFNISLPSPQSAQLVNVLVTEIVPNYWTVFDDASRKAKSKTRTSSDSERELLLSCLRSVTGISAILLKLKTLIQESKEAKKNPSATSTTENLRILLDVLEALLQEKEGSTFFRIWDAIQKLRTSPSQQKLLWSEFTSLTGGGKIVAVAAEAADVINVSSKEVLKKRWVANGALYCSWVARNIVTMSKQLSQIQASGWKNASGLLGKSFRLGHTGEHKSFCRCSQRLTTM